MTALYYGLGCLYLLLDVFQWPQCLYGCKIQRDRPFVASGSRWNPPWTALAWALAIGTIGVTLPSTVGVYVLSVLFGGVRWDCELPGLWEVVWQLLFFVVVEEVLFFSGHLLLHQKPFYAWIHKKHHEFKAPIALAAQYAHPVEQFVANLLPVLVGPMVAGAHLTTLWLWLTIVIVGTLLHHSGYRMWWTPSFDHQPDFHDLHHSAFYCNFGLLGVCDLLWGTYRTHSTAQSKNA